MMWERSDPTSTPQATYFASLLWCVRNGAEGPLARIRGRVEGLPGQHGDREAVEGGILAIEAAIERLTGMISESGRNG
jgi:hypothetical protein